MNPLHLTWCLWADHDLAQCSTPRPEQSKLLPFISAKPPAPVLCSHSWFQSWSWTRLAVK